MGNVLAGGLMVFFVVICNLFVAFIQTGATDTFTPPGCSSTDNITTCNNVSRSTFTEAFLDVSLTGLDNAPIFFNVLYVLVLGILLIFGIILMVAGFIGVPFGGG